MTDDKERTIAIALLEFEETLRQKRETFDQRRQQDARWFNLRLTMGFMATFLLPVVAFVMLLIMSFHERFPSSVVVWAGGVLFADVVGLLIAIWKFVLNPSSVKRLEPVTSVKSSLDETE